LGLPFLIGIKTRVRRSINCCNELGTSTTETVLVSPDECEANKKTHLVGNLITNPLSSNQNRKAVAIANYATWDSCKTRDTVKDLASYFLFPYNQCTVGFGGKSVMMESCQGGELTVMTYEQTDCSGAGTREHYTYSQRDNCNLKNPMFSFIPYNSFYETFKCIN